MTVEIVKVGDDGYTLRCGDDECEEYAAWGDPLIATLGGKTYLSMCDLGDNGDVTSLLDDFVYEVARTLADSEVEVVEDEPDLDDDSDDDLDSETEDDLDDEEIEEVETT